MMDHVVNCFAVFIRALGCVYAIALGGYTTQLVALVGSRGISPLRAVQRRLRTDLGVTRACCRAPSLFWCLGASDAMLRLLPALGAVAAIVLAMGGGLSVTLGGASCAAAAGDACAAESGACTTDALRAAVA